MPWFLKMDVVPDMTGRMHDEGGYIHKQRNTEMEAYIEGRDELLEYRQTGMAYLIDRNNEKLSAQLIGGLSIAFLTHRQHHGLGVQRSSDDGGLVDPQHPAACSSSPASWGSAGSTSR